MKNAMVKSILEMSSLEVRVVITSEGTPDISYPTQNALTDNIGALFAAHMIQHRARIESGSQVEHLFNIVNKHPETNRAGMFFVVETYFKETYGEEKAE